MIVCKKYCLNLESFLKHDIYSHIDGLDLFSERTRSFTNRRKYSKWHNKLYKKTRLHNSFENSCYNCFYIKKFFKIQIDKMLSKIDNVTRKIMWIIHVIYQLKNKRG